MSRVRETAHSLRYIVIASEVVILKRILVLSIILIPSDISSHHPLSNF